jgi:hypothetical protein
MVDSERIIGPDEIARLCGVRNVLKQIVPDDEQASTASKTKITGIDSLENKNNEFHEQKKNKVS